MESSPKSLPSRNSGIQDYVSRLGGVFKRKSTGLMRIRQKQFREQKGFQVKERLQKILKGILK